MEKNDLKNQIDFLDNSLALFQIADGYLKTAKEISENLMENINFALKANQETREQFKTVCISFKNINQ